MTDLDDSGDDEKWSKVEGSRRKSLVARQVAKQKAQFAATCVSRLSKVHRVACPFLKK
jgi:hypothetical protein